jgi:hypothetical protein
MMPEPLLFPEFLYGELSPTQRKMKAEANKWGRRFAKSSDFPEPKLIPILPGSIVFWLESAVEFVKWGVSAENDPEWGKVCALAGRHVSRWHLHHLISFRSEIPTPEGADYMEIRPRLWGTYENFLCRYPWGALTLAIAKPLYRTILVATRRIEALLSFWEPLDTIRYVDIRLYPVSLTDLVRYTYRDVLATWIDKPSADLRVDLHTTITNILKASEDEIRARALRGARWVIETWPHLKHRQWLKTPGLLERELERLRLEEPDVYADLPTSGGGVLAYKLDRVGPEGTQL